MTQDHSEDLRQAFAARYNDPPAVEAGSDTHALLNVMATRGSCRDYLTDPVPEPLLRVLCATALAAPTKSDLQQRDIILLTSVDARRQLSALVAGQPWVAKAPMIAIFCGNNRRQRLLHDWKGVPFANDHLDAFFNAVGDAAIALSAFVTAAEASGLGCCPISAVRNQAAAVSDLLALPPHVFPFAGLAIGYPRRPPDIAMRLPLGTTCHVDRYDEAGLREAVESYDTARAGAQPYTQRRLTETFGTQGAYGWSDDKVRQYSVPERADFGEYVRDRGFRLD